MGESIDIHIPDIEKELESLSQSSKNKTQIKACLFTLIIYAHELRRVKHLQGIIDIILDRFPCRIIFIQEDTGKSKQYFHVEVAIIASSHKETMAVCDQITITTSTSELRRVPYVVIPHIVPDLPVYLLWSQTPVKEHLILPALQPYASRIIFDAEFSDNLRKFSEEMLQSLNVFKMDVMDINWALFSNWRDMLVQLFDTPAKLAILKNCKSLKIKYQGAKRENCQHPEIRSVYLQGWLAAALKWTYYCMENIDGMMVISYTHASHPSIVSLCPQDEGDLPPGAIISIELQSIDGHSFTISRNQTLSQVLVHASSPDTCEMPYTLPLPNVHQGLTFIKEIFYHQLSNHYRDMLKIIAHLG